MVRGSRGIGFVLGFYFFLVYLIVIGRGVLSERLIVFDLGRIRNDFFIVLGLGSRVDLRYNRKVD